MYRRSQALQYCYHDAQLFGVNILTQSAAPIDAEQIAFLDQMPHWSSLTEIAERYDISDTRSLTDYLTSFVEVGWLVTENSPQAETEELFTRDWRWGDTLAAYHWSLRVSQFTSVETSESIQQTQLKSEPQPDLVPRWPLNSRIHKLPEVNNGLVETMRLRRTVREDIADCAISLGALTECLYAGLGIVGKTRNKAGTLPVGMTPSGGARNPFDAYIAVKSVAGLEPGLYQYCPVNHGLVSKGTLPNQKLSFYFGDQPWIDGMGSIIFLVANFKRSMWKYNDPNAYRVVMIEAGHIGQNAMLAATNNDLTACPSAALRTDDLSRALNLDDPITKVPVYGIALGQPRQSLTAYKPEPFQSAA